jgi:hypothetical protein
MSNRSAARPAILRFLRSTSGRISVLWLVTTAAGLFAAVALLGVDFDETTPFGAAFGDEIQTEPLPDFNPNVL